MEPILLFSEPPDYGYELMSLSREIAKALNTHIEVAVNDEKCGTEYGKLGANIIYVLNVTNSKYEQLSYGLKDLVLDMKYKAILAPDTRASRMILAYLAQELGVGMVSGAYNITVNGDRIIMERQAMSGKAVYKYSLELAPAIFTVQRGIYKPPKEVKGKFKLIHITVKEAPLTEVIEFKPKEKVVTGLETADVIVSVGRGLKNKDDLKMIWELAELLGAEVGCSRPLATDLKFLPEERWIGLSGKKVSPKVYIALGISGQPQHIAGIMSSKTIISVNKDDNAPIFKYSDYYIVGDIYEIVPKLIEKLKSRG